jgi:tetratricopeptide (TPR) repeat protein
MGHALFLAATAVLAVLSLQWPPADRAAEGVAGQKADALAIERLWECARDEWNQLQQVGKRRAATQILDAFLVAHPEFSRAHSFVGAQLVNDVDAITRHDKASLAERARLLEAAVAYLQAGLERAIDVESLIEAITGFARAYDARNLNLPAKSEQLWRGAIKRYPADPRAYGSLVALQVRTGHLRDLDAVMRLAHAQVAHTVDARWRLGAAYAESVRNTPGVPRDAARALLVAGIAAFDDVLTLEPEHRDALTYKAFALRTQAERVEPDPIRAKALISEADRLLGRLQPVPIGPAARR